MGKLCSSGNRARSAGGVGGGGELGGKGGEGEGCRKEITAGQNLLFK